MHQFRLDAEQVLLLKAAISVDEAAVKAWESWHPRIDWDGDLDGGTFRLLPQLARNLRAHSVDHPLVARFTGVGRKNWLRNQQILQKILPALSALKEAGIPVLVTQPHTLIIFDPEFSLDQQIPFSWAISQQDLASALILLQQTGWSLTVQLPQVWVAGFAAAQHSMILHHETAGYLTLAWALENEPGGLDTAEAWSRTEPARLLDLDIRVPDSARSLYQMCLDYNNRSQDDLFLLICNIVQYLKARNAPAVDWQQLANDTARWPMPEQAYEAFTELHNLFPLLVPIEFVKPEKQITFPPDTTDSPVVERGLPDQIRYDWSRYRHHLGSKGSSLSALVGFPGYLMAKWHLTSPGDLPPKVWRSFKHHGRRALR